MNRLFTVLCLVVLMTGCSNLHKPSEPTVNKKMLDEQNARLKAGDNPYGEASQNPTADILQSSLWAKSIGSPYIIRNQKAQKVGDLLTLLVEEKAEATTSANTAANRDNQINITGTLGGGQGASSGWGTLSAVGENKTQFTGSGETDRTGKFKTTVQASVEAVLPNGTLFVRGKKAITINNEDQDLEISGFVRPDDIRINNTVPSSVLADAEIRYIGKGVVADKQNTGWGTRLIDALWPF